MYPCERCINRGVETSVSRVLTVSDVVDELPDGELQLSNHDAFTASLCMACANDVQQWLQEFISAPRGERP